MWSQAAFANDGVATMAAGGLVLQDEAEIRMVVEHLRLSPEEVQVDYAFRNTAAVDKTVTVAFPLPPIDPTFVDEHLALFEASDNFVGFTTVVDGRPVPVKVEHRALDHGGKDLTAEVRAASLPMLPFGPAFERALAARPRTAAIEALTYDPKLGAWVLHTKLWWTQTFPADRDLLVTHTYRPVLGRLPGSLMDETATRWCARPEVVAESAKQEPYHYTQRRLEYVLTTGAGWAGPIDQLVITVDVGREGRLLATCTPLVQVGPTTWELRLTSVEPTTDLSILVLVPPGDPLH